jgi:hypothetical protein
MVIERRMQIGKVLGIGFRRKAAALYAFLEMTSRHSSFPIVIF